MPENAAHENADTPSVVPESDMVAGGTMPLLLVFANVGGIFVGYAITVILARHLTHYGFEQYIGTVATLGLLSTFGEAGFGKYALKEVPVLVARRNASLLGGYLRFAIVGCMAACLLVAMVAAGIEGYLQSGTAESVALMALIFLPATAGMGVAVDLLMALGRAATATLIARIIVPCTSLLLMVAVIVCSTITPLKAILCFVVGSLIGLLIALLLCAVQVRPMTRGTMPKTRWAEWSLTSLSFLTFSFLISWMFKATLVLTHHLPHNVNELAMLAPAFETGCLILLLSKSTDKYFQPTMAVVLESTDWDYGLQVRRRRRIFVGCGVGVFLAIIFLFGRQILRLYGDDFEAGFPALCIIAMGSSVWTIFSLAPTFLLFVGARKTLLLLLLGHGLLLAVLTPIMLGVMGATGAAIVYALSVSSLAISNLYFASAHIQRMRLASDDNQADDDSGIRR